MHILLFNLFFLLCLSGCLPSHYPQLADVPDYTPPSLSQEQAQKEIAQLRAEREPYPLSKND